VLDAVTPWSHSQTTQAVPLALDTNGDGRIDICFLTGVNSGVSASGRMEVHCLDGATNFTSSVLDAVTQWPHTSTVTAHPVGTAMLAPTTPSPPLTPVASAQNQAASISFSVPASNGRSLITSYSVVASPGGASASGAVSPIVVPGLANGTSYSFTVTATNAVGTSVASAPSNSVAPRDVPSAPSGVSATPDNGAATVTWSPPSSDGGAALTGYVVTAFVGYFAAVQTTFSSSATSGTVGGLSNGTTYRFRVAATNAAGTGSPSRTSGAVVAGAPAPPTGVRGTAGNGQATIRWTAPATNNGSTITGYVATPSLGGVAQPAVTFTSAATTETITGLSNAKSYTFSVAAKNANGIGPQSSASPAVTVGTPLAPTNANAIPGSGKAIISWTAPTSGNGSAISGYVVTAFVGFVPVAQTTFASTATTETFAGLSNGTTYRFMVAATNVNGTGSPSSATGPVVVGAPTVPANATGTAHVGSATVSWTAPSSNNGAAISAYVVTRYVAGVAQSSVTFTSAATTETVSGLTGGESYTFVVAAKNTNGIGSVSPPSNVVSRS
jgi:hypothetical protein